MKSTKPAKSAKSTKPPTTTKPTKLPTTKPTESTESTKLPTTKPTEDTLCVESIKRIMQIFGGKWSFVIIGKLHEGPHHFNELCKDLGMSTKSLSDALKNLEANEVITRTVYPTSPVKVEYALTDKGRDFEEVFAAMREWGTKWL